MFQPAAGIDARDYRDEFELVHCPTLVVRGSDSEFVRRTGSCRKGGMPRWKALTTRSVK